MRQAALEWAERDLAADNPHDLLAAAIAELVAQTRRNRARVAIAARTP
jgi:hypothetical protein